MLNRLLPPWALNRFSEAERKKQSLLFCLVASTAETAISIRRRAGPGACMRDLSCATKHIVLTDRSNTVLWGKSGGEKKRSCLVDSLCHMSLHFFSKSK